MSYETWERMRREANRAGNANSTAPRQGVISSYDPKRYAVKVLIMPEAVFPEESGESGETGWIPLGTGWAGAGYGDFAPPMPGTQVHIAHQEDSVGAGVVTHQFFDERNAPLEVPAGERWIVHKSTSAIKLTNDQQMLVHAKTELHLTADEKVFLTGTNEVHLAVGTDVKVDIVEGSVTVTVGGATLTVTSSGITSSVPIHAPHFFTP